MLSQDVKIGSAVRLDGKIYFCIDFQHVKPGKGNTIMRIKLKDVLSGNVLEKRFDIGVKLEDVRVEHRPYQYLYKEVKTTSSCIPRPTNRFRSPVITSRV